MTRFAVIDLETTGFGKTDRIVEIGIVLVDGREIIREWETLINPQRDISNAHIHGITPDLVSLAPTFDEVVDEVSSYLHGRVLVAHNIAFDGRILSGEFERLNRDFIIGEGFCTLRATRKKLSEACRQYGINNETAHRALTDARATALLLATIVTECDEFVPAKIQKWNEVKSTRVLSRAAMQSTHSPAHSVLRRIVRTLPIDGWDGPLLSYMDGLCSVLSDLRLTAEERQQLSEWSNALGLTDKDQGRVHEAFVESIVVAANRDSFISDAERELIERVAHELGVTINLAPAKSPKLSIAPGMRVCFTGQAIDPDGNAIDRAILARRAVDAGFTPVESVSKKGCDLVVAASIASMSGKAKKARDCGIPVISLEEFFIHLGV